MSSMQLAQSHTKSHRVELPDAPVADASRVVTLLQLLLLPLVLSVPAVSVRLFVYCLHVARYQEG